MALLTAAEMQARGVGVGLDAGDLQDIIDAEAAELARRFGPPASSMTETVKPRGNSLYLKRQISTVTSVTEGLYIGDPAPATRAAADYATWPEEGRIERSGAAAGWGKVATVAYTPVDDTNLRNAVLLELVRIATEQTTDAAGVTTRTDATAPDGSRYAASTGTSSSASGSGGGWQAARERQYARMGWLS